MKRNYQNKLSLSLGLTATMIFLFQISFAQKYIKYTLDDVISIARKQSPDALIAKHQFRKNYWQYRSFKATYLPNLSLKAVLPNVNRSYESVASQNKTISYTSQYTANYSTDLSLNQKIGVTGGEVFITSGLYQMNNLLSYDSTRQQFLSNIINIGFRQPIFTYNSYKWDKIIKPMEFEEAKRAYLESNENIAIKAIDIFFSLLSAQIDKEIAIKNYHNYDTLYKIAQGRYNLGKIAENDLLQLQLNLLKADASVENAALNYDNKLFSLKSFLRLKDTFNIKLIPPVITDYFDVPVQKAISEAKSNTSSSLEFQRRILEAESQVNMAKMQGRFNANISASYGLTQRSLNSIGDVYQNPQNQENLIFDISLPILDWGEARGKIKVAESNLDLVKTAVEQDKIDFEQNIYLQIMQFKMQKKQLYIAAKSDTVAQKRYLITHERYLIGKINDILELNTAQIDNDNARKNYFNTLKDYWENYYRIRKLTLFDFKNGRPILLNTKQLIQ